jgi:hypothetical protein
LSANWQRKNPEEQFQGKSYVCSIQTKTYMTRISMVTKKLVSFTHSAMAESGRMDGSEFSCHCSLIDFISS